MQSGPCPATEVSLTLNASPTRQPITCQHNTHTPASLCSPSPWLPLPQVTVTCLDHPGPKGASNMMSLMLIEGRGLRMLLLRSASPSCHRLSEVLRSPVRYSGVQHSEAFKVQDFELSDHITPQLLGPWYHKYPHTHHLIPPFTSDCSLFISCLSSSPPLSPSVDPPYFCVHFTQPLQTPVYLAPKQLSACSANIQYLCF